MSYPMFDQKRKDEYTILIPNMLPVHFSLIAQVFNQYGYHMVLLQNEGREVKDEGLRSIHNDSCYPLLIVTGQFLSALRSGKYDISKTAVAISQTGGGCRASNYLSLIRKALEKEFPQVPVLSLNFSGLEKGSSLQLPWRGWLKLAYAALYGDFLMDIRDQSLPYQSKQGEVDQMMKEGYEYLSSCFKGGGYMNSRKIYARLLKIFEPIKIPKKRKPRVAIVGEIFVKYSPLANNHLLDFLVKEGYEPVEPGFMEFADYCIINSINDRKLYDLNKKSVIVWKLAKRILQSMEKKQRKALAKSNKYLPFTPYKEIEKNANRIINQGVKMGEGWLIPSEMVAFAEHGVPNIVCCQPFGCLPNHIVGKGMMRPVKRLCPNANIAAIDYDASATPVNQENRIKLMLANIDKEN